MWWRVDERRLPDGWHRSDPGRVCLEIRFQDSDGPPLPRNQQRRFAARALSASGDAAFSGETLATLTAGIRACESPGCAQNGQTFHMPRMFRIVYPAEIFAGAESSLAFLRS